jgi:predicted nuclease of predicted toxin-antitoxin system
VKLLFDQNLSPQLAKRLSDIFPGSKHVEDFRLRHESDRSVCEAALGEGFVIVTQDEDFAELAYVLDPAPKVIWLTWGTVQQRSEKEFFGFSKSKLRRSEPIR